MPVYTTQAAVEALYGVAELAVASDQDGDGSGDAAAITAAILSGAREIESFALAYGVVPTDVAADAPANAGTFPAWWSEANIDIALYRLSLSAGPYTKEKRQRYEDWITRLADTYPKKLDDGQVATGAPLGVTIVAGGDREFSAGKTVGL